ncbi:MAG: beta-xylosidase, partial [bacterium]
NVFRMMAKQTGQRVPVESSGDLGVEAIMRDGVRGAADVSAVASLAPGKLAILVWHYHDDDVAGPDANVQLTLDGIPFAGEARVTHYRIDETHSNAYAEWKRMGSPIAPTRAQYNQLEAAGQLGRLDAPAAIHVANGAAALSFALPRQAVSLIVVEWP